MSVRVVARIRPLLKTERDIDVILRPGSTAFSTLPQQQPQGKEGGVPSGKAVRGSPSGGKQKTKRDGTSDNRDNIVRIPNPKNEGEEYSFQFNGVYDGGVPQQELFDAEVAPSIKHLFNGFDVTIFAYGVTGTGKTHTMRGGKSLVDRGVIPRMLSAIYRRSRKIEKDSQGATKVDVVMSYYEIYNDKVFDLFEPPEKRTATGLPLRDAGGKTVVVGLTERPCPSLKEFEVLYDQANMNRSTSATKLNAHSSRSHAILCVKIVMTTGEHTRISTASAIDLAGSEDNRRTENNKERMVESASINKSLFVLAQCVEAISKKQSRIPYRESKMTRILSLGQNNGLTIMILNLAPIRSYHLDTLSSLNFANRTKKIEVRDVENEPIFKGPPRPIMGGTNFKGSSIKRQPLRPLAASINANIAPSTRESSKPSEGKPAKAFAVFSDKAAAPRRTSSQSKPAMPVKRSSPLKRPSDASSISHARPSKIARSADNGTAQNFEGLSADRIQELVEKKVEEVLAARELNDSGRHQSHELSEQLQRRLEQLEQRIEGSEDARAEGLSYLLMAKQHQSRGEDSSALKMYQLAMPFFPSNGKLAGKILALKEKITSKTQLSTSALAVERPIIVQEVRRPRQRKRNFNDEDDDEYHESDADEQQFSDEERGVPEAHRPKRALQTKMGRPRKLDHATSQLEEYGSLNRTAFQEQHVGSPRTRHLLSVINSRDISQIRLLHGVGVKKAETIADCLSRMDQINAIDYENGGVGVQIRSLAELGRMKGVGTKTVESMRNGIEV